MSSSLSSIFPPEYKLELQSFADRPYLRIGGTHVPQGTDISIPFEGKDSSFNILKLFTLNPECGCDGVVLETPLQLFVIFRSATSTSTFMKIGMSGLIQSSKVLSCGATCNSFLGNYYEKHFSAALAAIVQAKREKKIVFLGYSMGAALGQIAMYDLTVTRSVRLRQTHLFLASPRIASSAFYKQLLDRGVRIRNMSAATRLGNYIHLDPIPLLKGFCDPPEVFIIGQLFKEGVCWNEATMPQAGTSLDVLATTSSFQNHLQCHPLAVFGSFMQTAFGQSCMDLHGSYRMLVYNGIL